MCKNKRTVYYNGEIITMNDIKEAEAIAIENGKIKYIGKLDSIKKSIDTEFIDLKGKTLMPAFIDPHSHITAAAKTTGLLSLQKCKNFDDIINTIKNYISENNIKPDEWVICFNYDHNNLEEKKHPTKSVLDKASKVNPILISHTSGHMGVTNSKALNELNINSCTQNPEGGKIAREENTNEPNGYFEETAFTSLGFKIPSASKEQLFSQLDKAQQMYIQNGITTIQDGYTKKEDIELLKSYADSKRLKADVISYIDLKDNRNIISEYKDILKKYNNHLKIGGYKIFLDGSPQGKTAWLKEPYINSGEYKGYPVYKDDEVIKYINESIEDKMQLICHCNGDAACEQYINCFSKALVNKPEKEILRPVMIHAQMVQYNQLLKMPELNMTASFFTAHTKYWGDVHIKNVGEERAFKISPAKSAVNIGVNYTFHTDTPVIMPNMLETIQCAVNRINKDNIVMGESERISVYEALKGVTINAAYQYFEENEKGTLEYGKNADIIILDKSPLKVDKKDIEKITVLKTIKEGKEIYSA